MPFNDTTKRVEALWAFVDEFIAGDEAKRADFDQYLGDMIASINALAAYLETPTTLSTDQRFLGRTATVPTLRLNGDPIEVGDFYIATGASGRENIPYVWNGAAFEVMSDFATLGAFFKDTLAAAADAATARGALGLGTASVQNAGAFAPASVADEVALALKLASDGLAKTLTDWDNAHTVGPGSCFVQGNAAAANAPSAVNLSGVYVAYDANNGFAWVSSHVQWIIYYRPRASGVWGPWIRQPARNMEINGYSINLALTDAFPGAELYRIGSGVTNLPSGAAQGDLLLNSITDANNGLQAILTRTGKIFMRDRTAGVNGGWRNVVGGVFMAADEKAQNTNGGTFTTGAWQTRVLNVVKANTLSGASLAGNLITLPPGTYKIDASCPAYQVNNHMARLFNVTAGTVILYGSSETCDISSNTMNRSQIRGVFTLAVTSGLRLEHFCGVTFAASGFGLATNIFTETYSQITIEPL